ncbi:YveK family protein [Romboutsia hominis]|uniref:YveK family protein n=1 Tax=Romboutsia hominis TaxID=1507512 RepID=UPI001F05EDE1|nr:Wzz/FepE/Etk N-terminal domain-containing protein [Romboutsia hominis]MCH1960641.1 Wzz/FepE/Etk N-terminal domain-containing protein [Romboutsia hominis]MCH1968927.1 Wzz/FepE/Etk N-terminal domain-containing protein [Romboutsia hominis]
MEETIDLKEYFLIIKKRFWIIALLTVLAAIISGVLSFFVLKPVYQANSTLIVNTEQNEETNILTGDQFTVTQKLAVTYGEIIKSRAVIEPVIKKLDLDKTYEELVEQIVVSPVKDTQIIDISVEDQNPKKARDIANEIPKVFTKEAKRITNANSVEVIDKAIIPENPIKPNKAMNVAIAAVLGLMIGLFVVFLKEYLDNKIKTPQDIEKHLDLPILGVIPNEGSGK